MSQVYLCCDCGDEKDETAFLPKSPSKLRSSGTRRPVRYRCRACETEYRRNHHHEEKYLLRASRLRARKLGVDFNLTLDDIIVPETCPLLEIPLSRGLEHLHDFSPTMDRIDPTRGYVRGNVMVISHRANRIKNNATLVELQTLTTNLVKYVPVAA
jgi:hypothetical protein